MCASIHSSLSRVRTLKISIHIYRLTVTSCCAANRTHSLWSHYAYARPCAQLGQSNYYNVCFQQLFYNENMNIEMVGKPHRMYDDDMACNVASECVHMTCSNGAQMYALLSGSLCGFLFNTFQNGWTSRVRAKTQPRPRSETRRRMSDFS